MSVWHERGKYEDLRAVLDPADRRGTKNRLIDLIHKSALASYFPIKKQDVVLDFGCGIGRFTNWLGQRCQRVVGIELTWEMISAARRISGGTNRDWVLYDGHLPFASGQFDRVFIAFVLQHIEGVDALDETLKDIFRILKPGGQIGVIEQAQAQTPKVIVGYIEQRLLDDYFQAFHRAGFQMSFTRAIRVPGRLATWASRGLIPGILLPLAAKLDLYLAIRPRTLAPYIDYLMVFQK